MRSKLFTGLMAAAALAALTSAAHASPVAMASNMVGKPTFRSGDGPWRTLGVLQRLSPGDEVKCSPGESAVIMMFTDGVRFKVASGKTGTIEPTTVRGAESVGDMGGTTIRVAKAMTGLDTQPFLARVGHSYQDLVLHSNGIIVEGTPSVTWDAADAGVASYILTLFSQTGNVLWSTRVDQPTATLPADLPVRPNHPYVWTMTDFGDSGKAMPGLRWGIVTFLSQADADKLNTDATALQAQAAVSNGDATPYLLLSELYRQYGVYEGALQTLDAVQIANQPGIDSAKADLCAQVGPYAVMLYNLNGASTQNDSTTAQN